MKHKISFFQENKVIENYALLKSLQKNTVFEFCINITDGLGDAKHALDIFLLLSKIYQNDRTKLKLILVLDKDKIQNLPYLLDESLLSDVAICNIGETISEETYAHSIIVLSGWDKSMFREIPKLIIETITINSALADDIKQTNFFLNVSTSLRKEIFEILTPQCFVCSIGEYGPMLGYGGEDQFFIPPIIDTQMGLRAVDVGIKFDESIREIAAGIKNVDEAARALVSIQSKGLLDALIGLTDKFTYNEKLDIARSYLMTHHLVVGYATEASANALVSMSIATNQEYKSIDVIMPKKYVEIDTLKSQLSAKGYQSVVVLSSQGTILEEYQFKENDKGPAFRLIDYQRLDENDLKILVSSSKLLMGSGDNSLSMTLSNPTALFLIFLADWKNAMYEVIWKSIQDFSVDAPAKYAHLQEYFKMMVKIPAAYAPQTSQFFGIVSFPTYKDVNPDLFKEIQTYVASNKDDILYEWQHFVDYLYKHRNVQDYLTKLVYSAGLHQHLYEQKMQGLSWNIDLIKAIIDQNDPVIISNLIYSAIIFNDIGLIKFICSKVEFLPAIKIKHSLTTIALAQGKYDIAEILLEKDLDLLFKNGTKISAMIGGLSKTTLKFFDEKHINFLSYFGQQPNIPWHYLDEEDTNRKAVERFFKENNLLWLNEKQFEERLSYIYPRPNETHIWTGGGSLIELMPDIFLLKLADLNQVWCCYRGKYLTVEMKRDGLTYGPMLPEQQQVLEKLINEYKSNRLQTSTIGQKL